MARDLEVRYRSGRRGMVRAVAGVGFRIGRGETLALVGESGSGKSSIARAVLRVIDPDRGEVWLDLADRPPARWVDLVRLRGERLRRARRRIQMVFQDPYASLDPRQAAGDIIAEPMRIFRTRDPAGIRRRVEELMEEVGLDPRWLRRYPHEFSGGQRQRIGIARALALEPRVLVLDEPVSALDVSVRAQVMNLLLEARDRRGLSYLFIAHDLGLVRRIAGRVAVLYRGRIVEEGPVGEVYARPAHPYTEALLAAVPIPDPEAEAARRPLVPGGAPAGGEAGDRGCPFAPRCPKVLAACREAEPRLEAVGGNPARRAACPVTAAEAKAGLL